MKTVFTICLLFFSLHSPAQEHSKPPDKGSQFTQVGQWQFSLALGVGQKTNPLHGGKSIPLYLIPSVYYYGEQFYFDDGTLGYSFVNRESFTLSAIAQINTHAANFVRWHPANIFIPNAMALAGSKDDDNHSPQEKIAVDVNSISKRKWALDGGIQLNYFVSDNAMIQARWTRDISNIYQGDSAQFKLEQSFRLSEYNSLSATFNLGIDWHSKALVDYYYGLNAEGNASQVQRYRGSATTNWFAGAKVNYQFNKHWRGILTWRTLQLGNGMSKSPLLKDSSIQTTFVGLAYDF